MNILVTGAAGLIGSHLVDELLERRHNVVGVDDLSFGSINNLRLAKMYENFDFYQCDLSKEFLLDELLYKGNDISIDFVFHLASGKKAFPNVSKQMVNQEMQCSDVLHNNSRMILNISTG